MSEDRDVYEYRVIIHPVDGSTQVSDPTPRIEQALTQYRAALNIGWSPVIEFRETSEWTKAPAEDFAWVR